jgi:hypothetical protein
MRLHISSARAQRDFAREREELIARADNGMMVYQHYLSRLTHKPIRLRDSYLSPFPGRHEKNASFNLFLSQKDGTIWFCDHAYESGNVFKFVMLMEGVEFKDAVSIIKRDVLGELEEDGNLQQLRRHFAPVVSKPVIVKMPPVITPIERADDWYQGAYAAVDEQYYPQALFGPTVLAMFFCSPLAGYGFQNEQHRFQVLGSPADPQYEYEMNGRHKIVRPLAPPPKAGNRPHKWISNTQADEDIFGLELLRALWLANGAQKLPALVVLAGNRDTMCFFWLTGIASIAFSAEKHLPTAEQLSLLYSMAENIYVLYDLDETGYKRQCVLTDQDEEWRYQNEGRYFGFLDADLTRPLRDNFERLGAKDITKLLSHLDEPERQALRGYWRQAVGYPE